LSYIFGNFFPETHLVTDACPPFHQGDQIGRIFAYWAIVFFRAAFWTITEVVEFFGLLFFLTKDELDSRHFG
jgi:hypothetical protein